MKLYHQYLLKSAFIPSKNRFIRDFFDRLFGQPQELEWNLCGGQRYLLPIRRMGDLGGLYMTTGKGISRDRFNIVSNSRYLLIKRILFCMFVRRFEEPLEMKVFFEY